MEEFRDFLTFLELFDPRFLPPVYLFLSLSCIELDEHILLLLFHLHIPSSFHTFLMDEVNVLNESLFILKYVTKIHFVPRAYLRF